MLTMACDSLVIAVDLRIARDFRQAGHPLENDNSCEVIEQKNLINRQNEKKRRKAPSILKQIRRIEYEQESDEVSARKSKFVIAMREPVVG